MNTILITGSSSGFGLATARYFLDRGWSVVAAMRTPRRDLFPESDRLRVVALDVTDASSIARAVSEAGTVDALVNNAGAGLMGALEGVSMDATRQLFELNTFGAIAMTQALLPGFRRQGAGVVVNVSSAVTLKPLPLLSAYTASKVALEAFSEGLALEVEPFGVRVRVVIPGRSPETSFGAAARARSKDGIPEAYAAWARQALSAAPPQPVEITTANDVAMGVWQAVTDASSPRRMPIGADAVALAAEVAPPIAGR
jgi:NAD(P)-dependent dehydrogenase (short-subunit alcohol dehydrogenase family)